MKRLYSAGDRVDAWLLRDRLMHANIDAHVFNQHMQAIVGDVPPDVASPQVWVDDEDYDRAQAVLAAFRTRAENAWKANQAMSAPRSTGLENLRSSQASAGPAMSAAPIAGMYQKRSARTVGKTTGMFECGK